MRPEALRWAESWLGFRGCEDLSQLRKRIKKKFFGWEQREQVREAGSKLHGVGVGTDEESMQGSAHLV